MGRPLEVVFGTITADNIGQLRKLNAVSFPIQYNESFYQDILKKNKTELNKLAYWNGNVVGAICTRCEEADKSNDNKTRLYIMTLAVLAAYRGRGIGSQLLRSVLDYCHENRIAAEISLHVQVSNQGAIDFYTKRFNFTLGERVDNYYRRIDPPHCYRLFKDLEDVVERLESDGGNRCDSTQPESSSCSDDSNGSNGRTN